MTSAAAGVFEPSCMKKMCNEFWFDQAGLGWGLWHCLLPCICASLSWKKAQCCVLRHFVCLL